MIFEQIEKLYVLDELLSFVYRDMIEMENRERWDRREEGWDEGGWYGREGM